MKGSRLWDALHHRCHGAPPVWFMRQAGRYLPEYQDIRKKYTLSQMFHDQKVIEEVTLQPYRRYGVDALIVFADILLVPEALGLELSFVDGVGPVFASYVQSSQDLEKLQDPDWDRYAYLAQAIANIKRACPEVPLFGFSGGPFTTASYMAGGKQFVAVKSWMFQDKASFEALLETLTSAVIAYLQLQVDAGVEVLQIFESHLDQLSPEDVALILPYLQRIRQAFPDIPMMLFSRGHHYRQLASVGFTGLSVDWRVSLPQVRQEFPDLVLQGNLDPILLFAPEKVLRSRVRAYLSEMKGDCGFIVNLGHGVLPQTPLQGPRIVIEEARHEGVLQQT